MGKNTGNEDLACVLIEELHDMKYVCPEHLQSKDLNKKKSRLKKCKWNSRAIKYPVLLSKIEYSAGCQPCGPCGPYTQSGTGSDKTGSGSARIIYKPYVPPCHEDHDHKNMRLKRPMSPHLLIYAPSLPAMTSITQRITGTVLVFYAIMLSGGTLFLSNGVDTYVSMIQSLHLSRPLLLILKLLLGLPFAFHYAFGLRFCIFNLAKFLTKKEIYDSAYKAFALAGIVSLLFLLL